MWEPDFFRKSTMFRSVCFEQWSEILYSLGADLLRYPILKSMPLGSLKMDAESALETLCFNYKSMVDK